MVTGLLTFAATISGLAIYLQGSETMTGDFRVAIAAFEVIGGREDEPVGEELAHGVYLRMEEAFTELSPGFTTTIWSPDQVGTVRGATREARAQEAARKAEEIHADIIVYGLVDTSQPVWSIMPEFYISDQNLTDAQEITGQHEIGEPFEATGQGNVATRIEVSTKLGMRAQIVSVLTIGLAYYAAQDYARALSVFEQLERDFDWTEVGGQEVLYLLLGNAAGKSNDLDTAERAYRSALAENPGYSRAYAGLGSTYYMRALEPVEASGNGADIDLELLNKSIDSFHQAAAATVRPALSDIPAKVHFGLGQAYLALHLQNENEPAARAVEEFDAVIGEYDTGDNPRIRELAAEAHARLGLIHDLNGNRDDAIAEYEKAVSLLDDVPDRQRLYEDRLRELRNDVSG
jgi:tetratricopeptide (TPR) repeat protein